MGAYVRVGGCMFVILFCLLSCTYLNNAQILGGVKSVLLLNQLSSSSNRDFHLGKQYLHNLKYIYVALGRYVPLQVRVHTEQQ